MPKAAYSPVQGCLAHKFIMSEVPLYRKLCKPEMAGHIMSFPEVQSRGGSRNIHPSGWLRASALTCRLISLVGVKWSCLRINKHAFRPLSTGPAEHEAALGAGAPQEPQLGPLCCPQGCYRPSIGSRVHLLSDASIYFISPRPSAGSTPLSSRLLLPETRNSKPETRNPKPETRNPKPETLVLKPCTRSHQGCLRFCVVTRDPA